MAQQDLFGIRRLAEQLPLHDHRLISRHRALFGQRADTHPQQAERLIQRNALEAFPCRLSDRDSIIGIDRQGQVTCDYPEVGKA